jgi:ubiquinone/menaquinone biosynthesis C-methylase UbiE
MKPIPKPKKAINSWGKVARWYNRNLSNPNSFQSQVILPNLIRLFKPLKSDRVLDLACGQGFFCEEFENICQLTGIDIGPELIQIAKQHCPKTEFYVCAAEKINSLRLPKFDHTLTVLALQNIADLSATFKNVSSLMNTEGKWHIVMNHPSFRQPQASGWLFDNDTNTQNRVITKYLSNYKVEMKMNPSDPNTNKTLSYHRSLQEYIKIARNTGFALTNMEEWISHIPQDQGPKTPALEAARKEIPMFLYLEFTKIK